MRPRALRLRAAVPAALLVVLFATVPPPLRGATPAVDVPGATAAAPPPSAARSPVASLRLIVRTGDRAPDGGTYTKLADPALNDAGDLAFGAETTAQESAQALFLRHAGRTTTLVAAGRLAATGGTFATFSDVVLNNKGTAIFLGRTTVRDARLGIYAVRNGVLAPVVITGQPAPSGGVFTDFANATINDDEVIAFVGRTNGTGTEGIYTSSGGKTTARVMGGWPAPTGGLFLFFLDGSPALNGRGQIAFVAATTEHATQGVYVLTGDRVVPVVTTDDLAPVGARFTEFGFVNLTRDGTVGFVGRSARGAVHEALYATGREALVTLARVGDTADDGVPFPTFTNVLMNSAEDTVFEPGIVRFPDVYPHTIYLARRSGVAVIAREGEAAPGGAKFTAFSQAIINDHRQVAFVAETDDGRHGIYLMTLR